METGRAVTPPAAIVRNLVRLLDCYFPLLPFLPGLVMVFLHPRNQRLGDLAAGTIVVRARPVDWGLGPLPPPTAVPDAVETGPPELSDDEFRLLDQFLARSSQRDAALQVRLATELARRFQDRIPRRTADADVYLTTLHAEEQRKRRSRFATRAQSGAAGRTTVTAERFVAGKRDAWAAFHAVATRVERAGVGALTPGEIPAFPARHREATAHLPRAPTSRVGPPVIASAIISNNIGIAFWAFVGGMLAGTLTALVLVGNGVSLGMGFGLFVNYHAGGYLATFVAGHGILELTAIFIAGGAGFRLAGALLLPGDLTRADALVLQGRIAARMIGAVVTLLALAGTIEGLLSASDAPAAFKYAVSASTVALLGLYLWSGWTYLKSSETG